MGTWNAVFDNVSGVAAIEKTIAKKYKKDVLAAEWINGNADGRLVNFNGTKAALDQRITDCIHDCGSYVHEKNWQISTGAAESECRNQLELKYSKLLAEYTGAQAKEEATLKAVALEKNSKLIAIVFVVLAVLITTVIILRIKSK